MLLRFGGDGARDASNSPPQGIPTSQVHSSQCGKESEVWTLVSEQLHGRDSGCNPPTVKLIECSLPLRRLGRAQTHPVRSAEIPAKFAALPSQIVGDCWTPNRSNARGPACATIHRTTRAHWFPPRRPAEDWSRRTLPLAPVRHSALSSILLSLFWRAPSRARTLYLTFLRRTEQYLHSAALLRVADGLRRIPRMKNPGNQRARINAPRAQQGERCWERSAARANDGDLFY